MKTKSIEELNEDYIEIVKLSWRFPDVYKMTLCKLQEEFRQRGTKPPIVKDPLEYL